MSAGCGIQQGNAGAGGGRVGKVADWIGDQHDDGGLCCLAGAGKGGPVSKGLEG